MFKFRKKLTSSGFCLNRFNVSFVIVLMLGLVVTLIFVTYSSSNAQAYLDQASGINGNQDVLGDPARPIIYWADYEGNEVVIWNFSSGAQQHIVVGAAPISLDLSSNGSFLFVAVSNDKSLVIIDLEEMKVVKSVELGFTPLSLTFISHDTLYVSSKEDTWIRKVNLTSWSCSLSFDARCHGILEASPIMKELFVAAQWAPSQNYNITLYNLSTPTPSVEVEKDLGSCILSQVTIDWKSRIVFIAAQGQMGFQKRSLFDLEVVATCNTFSSTNGIALSQDRRIVYGVCTGTYWYLPGGGYIEKWGSMIFILDAESFNIIGMKFLTGERGPIATSLDINSVFLGSPLERVEIGINVNLSSPAPGSEYGYSPNYMEFTMENDLITFFDVKDFAIYVDSQKVETKKVTPSSFRGMIVRDLPNGNHNISVDILGLSYKEWAFKINRTSTTAIMPKLDMGLPYNNSRVSYFPPQIWLQSINPLPVDYGIILKINDESTDVGRDSPDSNTIKANLFYDPNRAYGVYVVNATLEWPGGGQDYSWTFIYQADPILTSNYPNEGSIVPLSPNYVEASFFEGIPKATSIEVFATIDGTPYSTFSGRFGDERKYLRANLTEQLQAGPHQVRFDVITELGMYYVAWDFFVDTQTIHQYNHDVGFSLLIPDSWMIEENASIEGEQVDLLVFDPALVLPRTNILFSIGQDATVREDEGYLSDQIEKTINVLKDKNINAILRAKEYSTISNHQAVIFVLDCVDQQITQKCALVICEKNQFYCLIVCTVSSNSFQSLNPAFDMIINSLELTYEPEPIIDFNTIFAYILVIGVICSVVIFIIVFKMKKRKE